MEVGSGTFGLPEGAYPVAVRKVPLELSRTDGETELPLASVTVMEVSVAEPR